MPPKQNQYNSYFFRIAGEYSISQIKEEYVSIKHLEKQFEDIHLKLPYPQIFDETVYLYISSYNTTEFILTNLVKMYSCVAHSFKVFEKEEIQVQNLFIDGYLSLMDFDETKSHRIFEFIVQLKQKISYIQDLSLGEIIAVFKIAHYFSLYPEDKIRDIESYKHVAERNKFDAQTLFNHLFTDKINPVLLTDHFLILNNKKDYQAIHLLINNITDLNTPELKIQLNQKEIDLLCSEKHPILKIDGRAGWNIENAIKLVKSLLNINLPESLIYRIFFDQRFLVNSLPTDKLISYLNEYINYIDREPTINELIDFLTYQSEVNDRYLNYPIFTKSQVHYLYHKEMSLYFKSDISVFTDLCDYCESLSGAPIIHLEWKEPDESVHFINYCKTCFKDKNLKYMMEFDSPF